VRGIERLATISAVCRTIMMTPLIMTHQRTDRLI
jgi:hypothetical protein